MRGDKAQHIVDRIIGRATERVFEEFDERISAGDVTQNEVTQALIRYQDFIDDWYEWMDEA